MASQAISAASGSLATLPGYPSLPATSKKPQSIRVIGIPVKVLERLGLIDRIGRALQNRMSYGEINAYLKAYGINVNKPTSGVNIKWVYSKELLSDESDDLLIRIADDLEVPHTARPGRLGTTAPHPRASARTVLSGRLMHAPDLSS